MAFSQSWGTADMRLTLDPWSADFGPSLAAPDAEQECPEEVDTEVELCESDWRPLAPGETTPDRIALVDGVRRVESYLRLEDHEHSYPAMLGTFACGAICLQLGKPQEMREALSSCVVCRRLLALGAEQHLHALPGEFPIPGDYRAVAVPGSDGDALLQRLQALMRAEEALVCNQLKSSGHEWILADGPLHYILKTAGRDVIGYVKSHQRMLLPNSLVRVLAELRPGERTPLLQLRRTLEGSQHELFTWYVRLVLPLGEESTLAGIARLEVLTELGLERARQVAHSTAGLLPRLGGGRHRDGRAPQNLIPISALERELKRRMGDAALIGRILRGWVRNQGNGG